MDGEANGRGGRTPVDEHYHTIVLPCFASASSRFQQFSSEVRKGENSGKPKDMKKTYLSVLL